MTPDLAGRKQVLRREARARRAALARSQGETAARAVIAPVLALRPTWKDCCVAGYWPLTGELDCRPLMTALSDRGAHLALPAVTERDQPLCFRAWTPEAPLEAGPHGTAHPPATAPEVLPTLILLPLLAFDRQGTRLGYGGGYYDRTLAVLQALGRPVLTVGLAFAGQAVAALPRAPHDQPLAVIVTEQGRMVYPGAASLDQKEAGR